VSALRKLERQLFKTFPFFSFFLGGGRGKQPLVPLPWPSIFPIILYKSTTLLTGMTSISLQMQWPLTSQLHGCFSQREQFFITEQTPCLLFKTRETCLKQALLFL
jgi:hypothetical protein